MESEQTAPIQAHPIEHLRLAGARVVVVKGPDQGKTLEVTKEEVVLGTGEGADLQLTDPTVSRLHVSIRGDEHGFLATDLDSKNGTRLDKHRIRSAYVSFGDTLIIGSTQVRLDATQKPVELELHRDQHFGPLVGKSVAARRLFALLGAVAPEESTVLLVGETGAGKDVCAEAIHQASRRAAGPFVVLDCAALNEGVIESELFGHVKGAFTGAHDHRSGAFVEANHGTLFIDEIGELPRGMQPKLLRALEKREVRPIGAAQPIHVDVRIIAATNRDLKREVNRGTFRADLFYRLNIISIHVPPLRERVEDVPLLATQFWRRVTQNPEGECPAELLQALEGRRWPGNVRELCNKVEAAALLNRTDVFTPDRPHFVSYREARREALDGFERSYLEGLMRRAQGNIAQAARLASMDRVYLAKLLQRHGLHKPHAK